MITTENLLDLIESMGRRFKDQADPGYYSFERRDQAAGYEKYVRACRHAWTAIKAGKRTCQVLGHLNGRLQGSGKGTSLIIGAMNGVYEKPIVGTESGWFTFEGDLYYVNFGDYLNLPRVERLANRDMPEDRRKLDGARKIAAMLPNPCTRVKGEVRAC